MPHISLYENDNINTLIWPETEEGKCAKNFLLPLIEEGTSNYIKNVITNLKVLKVDEHILPITVNETEYDNSYVVSFYSVIGLLEEKISKKRHWINPLLKASIKILGKLLKFIKINKVVIVNNWLFSTSLNPKLSEEQIKDTIKFLQKNFPNHMIVFRTVNNYLDEKLIAGLKHAKFQLVATREVFFYDPKCHNVWSKRDCKRDWRLLKESGYEVISSEQFDLKDGMRGLDLYKSLYIDKYTQYSPQYTGKFIEHLLKNKFLDLRAIKKENQIDGIAGYLKMYNSMIIPFFGYDTSKSAELGLYRMTNILGVDEATKTNFILNQSSGASGFKQVRGLVPYQEYMAFGIDHLKGLRRAFWGIVCLFSNYFLIPFLKK